MSYSYKNSGVDIKAGDQLVEDIKTLTKETQNEACVGNIGGFGAIFDLKKTGFKDPLLISATDGVGTKLKLALEAGDLSTLGIDLVAMCVNDIITHGGQPLFFLDYYATSELNLKEAKDLIAGIAEGCKQAGCALVGGETAEMPGLYKKGDFDIAGFCVGAVERNKLLPQKGKITEGDVIIGVPSSGFHSNGYSLIRKVIEDFNIYKDNENAFPSLNTLLTPTKIYVKELLNLIDNNLIKAASHITGGGLPGNVPRILPSYTKAIIDHKAWSIPSLFSWLQNIANIKNEEMFQTFNMGIGMVLIASKEKTADILSSNPTYISLGNIKSSSSKVPYCDIK